MPIPFLLLLAAPLTAPATLQPDTAVARRDTTVRAPRDTARARALETVTVRAVRTGDAAVARTTLDRPALQRAYTGQDVPLLLQQATAVTTYAHSGSQWNYSYFRLRGIDQSRINLTLDGIPLNEPEDQQLYFSNFADLASSIASVQVQRGVGTSTYGQASFGGSVNFETVPLAGAAPRREVQLGGGSFGAARATAQYTSGLLDDRFAVHARFSNQRADGYRLGSSHAGNSAFVTAGWFGDRDVLKLTLLTGAESNGQAYYPVPLAVLDTAPRTNTLDGVGDRFRQNMAALAYTRSLAERTTLATTVYGFDAGGWYEFPTWVEGTRTPRWQLASRWGGVVSALRWAGDASSLDVGVHALTYRRDHMFDDRPDLDSPGYGNRGYKSEGSAFVKGSRRFGAFTVLGDLQAREAAFRYRPTPGDGVRPAGVSWRFLNPRLGATWQARPTLQLFASVGRTGREPTRADLLLGNDNVSVGDTADVFPLTRIRPERVLNVETGAEWSGRSGSVRGNVYAMEFDDEIALTGATAMLGADLRRNVRTSYRRGIEFEGRWLATDALTLGATAAVSRNRILAWRDEEARRDYRDVPPVLTPAFVAGQQVTWRAHRRLTLTADGRYQSRQFLDQTGDRGRSAGAFFVADGGATLQLGRHVLLVQGRNLLDRRAFTAGDVEDGVARFFILAPRNVEAVLRLAF